jgi:hypothetical protein
MQAASGSLLTAGEWLGIVLLPTRHSHRYVPRLLTMRLLLFLLIALQTSLVALRRCPVVPGRRGRTTGHALGTRSRCRSLHARAANPWRARCSLVCRLVPPRSLYHIVWRRACHTQEDTMKQAVRRGLWWGGLLSLVVAVAWAQTTRPPSAAKSKLERLKIAVAPLGWDTNFTWLQTRSAARCGQL